MTAIRTPRSARLGVLSLAIAQALAMAPAAAQSLPSDFVGGTNIGTPVVTGGTGTETVTVNVTGPRAYAEWNDFNVNNGQTFRVTNTSTPDAYIFVNRVIGPNLSTINGRVEANGNFWLLNPNGILVGATGVFDVGGLLLSTATTLDGETEATDGAAFLAGTSPAFALGGATGVIVVEPGAQLLADIGTIALLANQVNVSGTVNAGTGEIAVVGAQGLTVGFDADLNAFTTLTLGAGSNQAVGAQVNGGDFTAARTVIAAAGMTSGQGNVLLANGGAAFLTFNNGDIELHSRDGDVVSHRQINAPGDLSIVAGDIIDVGGAGGVYVQGDYSITADDFYGGTFSAVLQGSNSSLSITDTAGGMYVGSLTAPGDINLTTTNGGGLTISNWDPSRPLQAGGDIRLTTIGGGNLALNGDLLTGATSTLTLDSSGGIVQNAGDVTAQSLFATSQRGIVMNQANQIGSASLAAGSYNILFRSNTAGFTLTRATTANGDITIEGDNGVTLSNATVSTGLGDVTFMANALVSGDNTVTSGGGMVGFHRIDGAAAGSGNLSVSSASGTTFTDGVGATSRLGTLSVTGDSTFHLSSVYTANGISLDDVSISPAAGLVLDAGTGALTTGDIATNASGAFRGVGTSVNISSFSGANASLSLEATTGSLTLGSGDVGGTATLRAAGDVDLAGVLQAAGNIDIAGRNVQLGTVRSTGGNVQLQAAGGQLRAGTVEAAQDIQVSASTRVDIGQANANGNLLMTVAGGSLLLGSGRGNAVDFVVGAGGSIDVTGALVANRLTATASGGLTMLGDNQIVELGNVDADGVRINNQGTLRVAGTVRGRGNDVTLSTTGGNLEIASTGHVTGNVVALSTDANFINLSGGDAVVVTDHWAIYSAAPAGNTFGGLDSGNTAIWNGTLGTRAPGSFTGNRYVFAMQPTLTFTSTGIDKTYGTDLNGSAGSLYTVSGLQAGVAGAFLGDTLASAFSGAPLVSSAGFDARASVAGGPYAVTLSNGTLASASGYGFAFVNTGLVTVDPLGITGTAVVDTKTYDGTTNGTGTVTLDGVLAGDSVGTGGTTFTFDDKNAGTGKTVTISGTTLTGADAGNYTLTMPASVLGEILRKAITGTVVVDTRTYDGTTDATGTVTLDGVVAGDSLGTSGTTFTFDDENAGSGKTVTISGTTLTGTDAGNYTLTMPASVLGEILRKVITGTVVVDTKTYDGTANGTGSVTLDGVLAGDDVGTGGATFTFDDKNAGNGKTVTISGTTLTGADAGNYTLTLPASVLGEILRKAIIGTVVVDTKTYDGTTDGTGTVTLEGVVAGDNVGTGGTRFTFDDKNAGTGKTVTIGGTTLTGADAGNYTLTLSGTALADILQRAITVTADPHSKPAGSEDPTLTWTITDGSLVAGDGLTGALTRAPGEAVGTYAIGQGTLDASSNYRLTFVGSTLTITELPLDPGTDAVTGRRPGTPTEVLGNLAGRNPVFDRDEDRLEVVDERDDCSGRDGMGNDCRSAQPR